MKRFVRRIFESAHWLFHEDDKKCDPPGIVMIAGIGAVVFLAIILAPAWVPIYCLGRWCGYFPQGGSK